MNLKQLEAFVKVAETKSFSEAAKQLFFTQPTISAHVSALEKELNTCFLIRNTRGVELSESGKELYAYAVQMLEIEKTIKGRFGKEIKPEGNVLRIGASTVPAQYILPNVMSTFHAEYPGEKLKLFETDSKGVIDTILSHHIDIGFTGTVIEKGNCKYLPFYEDELVVLTPSNEKFVEKLCGGQILADWIMDEPVILREEGSGTKKEAEKMLAEQGIDMKKLKLAALMENQETIKRSVSKGMGVTILSKLAAEEELKNGTLLAFPLGSQGGKRMINLVYDAEYPLLPAAERFIKMIKRMYLKKENTGIGECK
ncbi:MAG: LysR family transcriptional regulator [Mediterraneibacter faecis]|nr:selenium metabolism-associated LysR family transcriptional regulator [Mediterraneibacter faecis]MCI7722520.1 LysR family transcriptional regulator [Mediterraneibacter faecis]